IGIQHVVGDVCSQHITHDDSSLLSPSATLLYLLPYAHDNHSGASVYIRTACNTAIPSVSRQKLTSFCRKTYKSLINQENGSIQDQTSDKPERRSGCGFRRGVGPASRTARPSRSGLVCKLRLGVTAPSHPIGSEQKIS